MRQPGDVSLRRWLSGAFFLIASIAPLRSIQSHDYFWHLAAGRWIVEHRALPLMDPFAVGSDPVPWINGEWLFEVVLYLAYTMIGHSGIAVVRALSIGVLFTLILTWCSRRDDFASALFVTTIAWYGAVGFLGERPSALAPLFVVLAIHILEEPHGWRRLLCYGLLTILWVNVHPSALLAPMIAGVASAARFFPGEPDTGRRTPLAVLRVPFVSALALLLNPFGIEGVLAPFRLVALVTGGTYTNREWQHPTPHLFPLFYVAVAAAIVLFFFARDRRGHLWRAGVLALLTVLAFRFLRNQALFFTAYPLVIVPMLPPLRLSRVARWLEVGSIALLLVILITRDLGLGIDAQVLPVKAVDRLTRIAPAGNIVSPDHFGGFLIWTFYPERRVLFDGRNELFREVIWEYGSAQYDVRAWRFLLEKYHLTLAVDEYRSAPIDMIDAASGTRRRVPASLVFFPRDRWALIAFDDVAMVFADRNAWRGGSLADLEYRVLVPDDPAPAFPTQQQRLLALREIARARAEVGESRVLSSLELAVLGGR